MSQVMARRNVASAALWTDSHADRQKSRSRSGAWRTLVPPRYENWKSGSRLAPKLRRKRMGTLNAPTMVMMLLAVSGVSKPGRVLRTYIPKTTNGIRQNSQRATLPAMAHKTSDLLPSCHLVPIAPLHRGNKPSSSKRMARLWRKELGRAHRPVLRGQSGPHVGASWARRGTQSCRNGRGSGKSLGGRRARRTRHQTWQSRQHSPHIAQLTAWLNG
jgi:hypothetical protein